MSIPSKYGNVYIYDKLIRDLEELKMETEGQERSQILKTINDRNTSDNLKTNDIFPHLIS